MNSETRGAFCCAACMCMIGEIMAFFFWQHGTDLWLGSPNPNLSCLLAMLLMIVLPCGMLHLLWLTQRNFLEFCLLAVVASTLIISLLMAFGAVADTLTFSNELTRLQRLLGCLPIGICGLCYWAWLRLRQREVHPA